MIFQSIFYVLSDFITDIVKKLGSRSDHIWIETFLGCLVLYLLAPCTYLLKFL